MVTFSSHDLGHLLLALGLLLCVTHALGYAFRRLRQPPVIGEILAGILLGPTVFGVLPQDWQESIFSDNQPTASVLGAVSQLGLLLLMFCSGAEMKPAFGRAERRISLAISLAGILLPLAAGLLLVRWLEVDSLLGPAGNRVAFSLVFGIAIAVTSIPVISRILTDLGIIESPFARIVLAAAVAEDVVLYVILSAALALVGHHEATTGVAAHLGLRGDSWGGLAYHALASVAFFTLTLLTGPAVFRGAFASRFNVLRRSSPVANLLFFTFAAAGIAIGLGIAPMLGAFVAGLVVGNSPDEQRGCEVIKSFSFAVFIPIYFAVVGLNIRASLDLRFFIQFLVTACALKAGSVYFGARLVGESRVGATNLAVAMNARGGPGIVLASVSLDAGIISASFYSSLVLLAIVTSLIAGSWLDFVVRRGWPLRGVSESP